MAFVSVEAFVAAVATTAIVAIMAVVVAVVATMAIVAVMVFVAAVASSHPATTSSRWARRARPWSPPISAAPRPRPTHGEVAGMELTESLAVSEAQIPN